MICRATALCLTCLSAPALAHPHIFVDTTHRLIFDDQGRLAAVRVTWEYDELFSFTMLLDEDYDRDGDGHVTGDELNGFRLWDADWVEGYPGDIELFVDGRELTLEPPTDWDADWREGRAVSIHTRVLSESVDLTPGLRLRAFEPEFFTAYTITDPPIFDGRADCRGIVIRPDPDAVPAELTEQLQALDMDASSQLVGIVDLAQYYADEVHVTCGH